MLIGSHVGVAEKMIVVTKNGLVAECLFGYMKPWVFFAVLCQYSWSIILSKGDLTVFPAL